MLEYYDGGKGNYQFWTKWINGFSGAKVELAAKQNLLDRVAFYNFGDVMLRKARMPVPPHELNAARSKFPRVIEKLRPQLVIALSYRLWDMMPLGGEPGELIPRVSNPAQTFSTWHYSDAPMPYNVLFLPHPASNAWRSVDVTQAVTTALAQVAAR